MRILLLVVMAASLLAQQPDPCADCPDRTRPWMRGATEIACAHPAVLAAVKKQFPPTKRVVACHCQHTCDRDGELADMTDNRGWDAKCEARCSPSGCLCPHPCESE